MSSLIPNLNILLLAILMAVHSFTGHPSESLWSPYLSPPCTPRQALPFSLLPKYIVPLDKQIFILFSVPSGMCSCLTHRILLFSTVKKKIKADQLVVEPKLKH